MAKIKKAQRGGCLSTTGSGARLRIFKQAAGEGRSGGDNNRALRQDARNNRRIDKAKAKMEREEAKEAAKAAAANAPKGKSGLKVKKAQAGTNLDLYKKAPKKSAVLTEMGKKTTRAAINKRTDEMAKSLDKASVFGKNYVAPGDSTKKKKPVPKKKHGGTVSMQLGSYDRQLGKNYTGKKVVNKGAKAKMGKSVGKCKYGC